MFHTTSTECCNEMLHIYTTKGIQYANELGAPVNCFVVDACVVDTEDGTAADDNNNDGEAQQQ